jgi:hypothetical protein
LDLPFPLLETKPEILKDLLYDTRCVEFQHYNKTEQYAIGSVLGTFVPAVGNISMQRYHRLVVDRYEDITEDLQPTNHKTEALVFRNILSKRLFVSDEATYIIAKLAYSKYPCLVYTSNFPETLKIQLNTQKPIIIKVCYRFKYLTIQATSDFNSQ